MPGLLTTSAGIREQMLKRNFYRPDNPYDLRQDVVTRTLDVFQTAGFNLRTSPLLAGLEALVDNTPLLQVAAGQIAKNVALRYADRIAFEKLPTIKLENIFSKDPSKKIIGDRPLDWRVTPAVKANSLAEYVRQAFSRTPPTTGLETEAWPLGAGDPELQLGGKRLYDILGSAQKAWISEQTARNEFNRWPKQGQDGHEGLAAQARNFRNTDYLYPASWLAKRKQNGAVYGSYLLDASRNLSLSSRNVTPETLAEVIKRQNDVHADSVRLAEGFGQTLVPGSGPAEVRGPAGQLVYGEELDPSLGIERGLLYYTTELAKTATPQGEAMQHEQRVMPGRNELDVVWRGSRECRTFTLSDQYDNAERLIRWQGNGVADSVLHDTVVPRIAPQKSQDQRRLMFSLENLAWGPGDTARLPKQQRGPFGGRQMWFMPYGIGYAESATAKWSDVPLVGRIEDLHAYNGASRNARLTFILLADYPDAAQKISPTQLGAWFAGCETGPEAVDELEPRVPLLNRPVEPAPASTTQNYSGTPSYYFENDIFLVQNDYELTSNGFGANKIIVDPRNLYALNAGYQTELDALAEYVAFSRRQGNLVEIRIAGSCSALFTRDYNARLSFKRALTLAQAVVTRANSGYNAQLSVSTWPTVAQFEEEVTTASIKNQKKYTVTSVDGSVVFVLSGRGEEDANGGGQTEGAINTQVAKRLRRAQVIRVISRVRVTPPPAPLSSQSRHVQQQAQLRAQAGVSKQKVRSEFNPRFNGKHAANQRFAQGFELRDYLAPVYHSQTPYDLYERHEFLIQCTRPGNTVAQKEDVGSNSLYGRAPVCILRLGDFVHSKILIKDVSIDYQETKWDMNPEGMGMRPLLAKVSLDITLLGGQSLQGPINALLTATDSGYDAGSTFFSKGTLPNTSVYTANRYGVGTDPISDQPLAGENY
jgi:outer membrane protein OmpA-like peptidoglycan-associated protein